MEPDPLEGGRAAAAEDDRGGSISPSTFTAPPPPPPPPGLPARKKKKWSESVGSNDRRPDPRGYWRLWRVGYHDDDDRDGGPNGRYDAGATSHWRVEARWEARRAMTRQWEGELRRARYNERVQQRLDECDRRRRASSEHGPDRDACDREARALLQHRRELKVVPEAFIDDRHHWAYYVPVKWKHDRDLAWTMLHCDKPPPLGLQQMIWTDPRCPLRSDREILMASLRSGLDALRIQISWSHDLAEDRELVLKCFETCPGCLVADNGRNHGLPVHYLEDVDMIRAFAFSSRPQAQQCREWTSGIHTHFHESLFLDPMFMADLLLHLGRVDGTCPPDRWSSSVVREAFPDIFVPGHEPKLLDSEDFALHLARGMVLAPDSAWHQLPEFRPVTYRTLSPRLQEIPEVALAFFRWDATMIFNVPPQLRRKEPAWRERWDVAMGHRPGVVHHPDLGDQFVVPPFSAKDLVLHLLRGADSKERPYEVLNDFADVFPALSSEIQLDRDICMQMALACARWPLATSLRDRMPSTVIQSREFWIELAEQRKCRYEGWSFMPGDVAADAAVVLAWARHARPCTYRRHEGFITNAGSAFPLPPLLTDRQVLLNWLPTLGRDLWSPRDLPPEIQGDKSFWLELLHSADDVFYLRFLVPQHLKQDIDVVDAYLGRCVATWRTFRPFFSDLPLEVKQRCGRRLVEAIEGGVDAFTDEDRRNVLLPLELVRIPEVALAAFSKGWDLPTTDYARALRTFAWSNDPAFLLTMAERRSAEWGETFWGCCSEALRRNKAFLLDVLNLEKSVPLYMDRDLNRDYDILCALYARGDWDRVIYTRRLADFLWTVRGRLEQHLSLETFMAGVTQTSELIARGDEDRLEACPLSLLLQDGDTLHGLHRRLVEYLGSPSSHHEARVLRKVSNRFARHGY